VLKILSLEEFFKGVLIEEDVNRRNLWSVSSESSYRWILENDWQDGRGYLKNRNGNKMKVKTRKSTE
jgi:hypothetical protein